MKPCDTIVATDMMAWGNEKISSAASYGSFNVDSVHDVTADLGASFIDPAPLSAEVPAPVGRVKLQKPQQLLEDTRGMYSNAFTVDWTTSPITAMKLTIEYTEEMLREVPRAIDGIVQTALIDAADANKKSSSEIIGAFRTIFHSKNKSVNTGYKGVLPELEDRITAYGQLLGKHHNANEKMAQLVETMAARSAAIEELGKRELVVVLRENKVRQCEIGLNKKLDDFEARGFWGHIGNAYLSRSHVGVGFGVLITICLLVFAALGLVGTIH